VTFQLQIDKNSFQFHILYIGMNPLEKDASTRTKEDIQSIKRVYIDLDHGAAETRKARENSSGFGWTLQGRYFQPVSRFVSKRHGGSIRCYNYLLLLSIQHHAGSLSRHVRDHSQTVNARDQNQAPATTGSVCIIWKHERPSEKHKRIELEGCAKFTCSPVNEHPPSQYESELKRPK
jgi:hypothetical protein